MQERIKQLLLENLCEDEGFCEAFCEGCGAITHDPGDYYNPPETNCPADFAIGDSSCVRAREWLRIENAIDQAAEVAADTCTEEEIAI